MQFSLESKPLGTVERYIIHADDAELEILAGWGSGLNAWRVPTSSGKLDLLYGYCDAELFRKIQADTNAGAILSPFPGRTAFAKWNWKGKSYKLVNNVSWAPHALHGFLNVLPWRLSSFRSDDRKAVLSLERDFYGIPGSYPFTFRATNCFFFCGSSFRVQTIVQNTYHETLPYAQGFHPYFSLGNKIDALSLELPKSHRAKLDTDDIPTGEFEAEIRFDGKGCLGETFINDYFSFDEIADERAAVRLCDSAAKRSIEIWQQTGKDLWRGVQIYTPPDRESIAIEPMTSAPDVLNHHRELIEIAPGKSIELLWGADFRQGSHI